MGRGTISEHMGAVVALLLLFSVRCLSRTFVHFCSLSLASCFSCSHHSESVTRIVSHLLTVTRTVSHLFTRIISLLIILSNLLCTSSLPACPLCTDHLLPYFSLYCLSFTLSRSHDTALLDSAAYLPFLRTACAWHGWSVFQRRSCASTWERRRAWSGPSGSLGV